MQVDRATEEGARGEYARVCVQVDLTKPLLSKFKIDGNKYFIQYEELEKVCYQVWGIQRICPLSLQRPGNHNGR
ncbi:unnamed protein product [Linum tenue]|uniref:Uncharacterized protein n=1 Tax=Linum tenue TaxID=586396 RepID=A0AAV0Q5J3_9ROSI|nr:unnamed protein product [Linum tenue]